VEGMTPTERELLARAIGSDAEPALCLRSNTRVDAGWWLRRAPVWLCITDDQAIVLAAGRRHHVASVSRDSCRNSRYDHATGEVVIEPGDALRFDRLAFLPREALRILSLLGARA
jgi:hypothetical protein